MTKVKRKGGHPPKRVMWVILRHLEPKNPNLFEKKPPLHKKTISRFYIQTLGFSIKPIFHTLNKIPYIPVYLSKNNGIVHGSSFLDEESKN